MPPLCFALFLTIATGSRHPGLRIFTSQRIRKETANLTPLPALWCRPALPRAFDQLRSKRQLLVQGKAFTLAN
jgi:hypothetical protein